MAVLTKKQMLERTARGDISFTPALDSFQMQEHSVDLRLGFTFMAPKRWVMKKEGRTAMSIDPMRDHGPEYFDIIELEEGQYFDLLPAEFVLVSTLEEVQVPSDLMAVLYPRSSVNRKGLSVDLTGIIDAGYEGVLTLPIKNNTSSQTIRLHPGERICQIVFEELTEPVKTKKSRWHKRDVVDKGPLDKSTETAFILRGEISKMKEKFKYIEPDDNPNKK